MELATTPMTERQRKYRENYRQRVAGWYNGWLHILLIYTIGFTALYVYIANLHRWWEYLAIPVVFMFANFFEWAVHRDVMHRPSNIPMLRAIYSRHTMMHHQFFTEQEMRFADHHDWRVTFFPPFALVVFTFMSIPPAIVAGWLISPNVGWLLISTTTSMYLIYEFMHLCCHVDVRCGSRCRQGSGTRSIRRSGNRHWKPTPRHCGPSRWTSSPPTTCWRS